MKLRPRTRGALKWAALVVTLLGVGLYAVSTFTWIAIFGKKYFVEVARGAVFPGMWTFNHGNAAGLTYELPSVIGLELLPKPVQKNPDCAWVVIPLWLPVGLFAAVTITLWRYDRRHCQLENPASCIRCGYDRTGIDSTSPCPECGYII